jgi:hypothetical protein
MHVAKQRSVTPMPSIIVIIYAMQRSRVIGKLISSHLGEKKPYTCDPILITKLTKQRHAGNVSLEYVSRTLF